MENKYTIGECKQCGKYEALKNDCCVECSRLREINNGANLFDDLFGNIFKEGDQNENNS